MNLLEPTDSQIEVHRLHGEILFHGKEVSWWAEEMLFWRTKYLLEHPELANNEYVKSAREQENIDPMIFL